MIKFPENHPLAKLFNRRAPAASAAPATVAARTAAPAATPHLAGKGRIATLLSELHAAPRAAGDGQGPSLQQRWQSALERRKAEKSAKTPAAVSAPDAAVTTPPSASAATTTPE